MKKILIFKNNWRSYSEKSNLYFAPNAFEEPVEEIDVTNATRSQIDKIKANFNDTNVLKRFKRQAFKGSDIIKPVTELRDGQ